MPRLVFRSIGGPSNKAKVELEALSYKNVRQHILDKSGDNKKHSTAMQSAGGAAKKGKTKLSVRLTLKQLAEDSDKRPYAVAAEAWRRAEVNRLGRMYGQCGVGPSSLVTEAALQLLWARYWSDQALEAKSRPEAAKLSMLASRLGSDHSHTLVLARKEAAEEAAMRKKGNGPPAIPIIEDEPIDTDGQPVEDPSEDNRDADSSKGTDQGRG